MTDKNGKECNAVCAMCGKEFYVKPYMLKKRQNHYCSRECYAKARSIFFSGENNHQYGLRGDKNSSWKHDEKIKKDGYRMVRCIGHPFSQKDDYIMEHRLVAEKYLLTDENSVVIDGKRYLSPDYVVHHKNGNKLDNRPENLEVMTKKDHVSMHSKQRPKVFDPFTHHFLPKRIKTIVDEGGYLPERAHSTDAGFDIKTPEAFCVPAGGSYLVSTKVHMRIPRGYAGFIKSKSGLNTKNGLLCEGVVDAHYTGEIKCKLYNHSDTNYYFEAGDKITQIVILPVITPKLEVVDELDETERGSNGFGSTGR